MADKYLANARLKIGGSMVEPGTDVTSSISSWRTLHSLLAAKKIVKVRTTVTVSPTNKTRQKIPTGSDRVAANVKSKPRTQPSEVFRRGTDV